MRVLKLKLFIVLEIKQQRRSLTLAQALLNNVRIVFPAGAKRIA